MLQFIKTIAILHKKNWNAEIKIDSNISIMDIMIRNIKFEYEQLWLPWSHRSPVTILDSHDLPNEKRILYLVILLKNRFSGPKYI